MKLYLGDCLEQLKNIKDNSVDAVITDPPYGLSFMGKKWDYDVPSQEIWEECLRVLKPGGYLLSFAGTRTQHRMAVRIEDAGFEIRDMIAWVYGSGFPKSLNIGKAVDKLQGNEREMIREYETHDIRNAGLMDKKGGMTISETKGTSEWEGWGTALKPALEPITVARKPLSEKTVAENCLRWGVGGINIDGCRVGTETINIHNAPKGTFAGGEPCRGSDTESYRDSVGRFPANLIHDGSDEVVSLFPNSKSSDNKWEGENNAPLYGKYNKGIRQATYSDAGSSARFFYCAKSSKSERNRGCEELENKTAGQCTDRKDGSAGLNSPRAGAGRTSGSRNNHPTVKPIDLMEYLVKLVSREGATVLDPFMGSGSTGIACINLNREFIGIEKDAEYFKITEARINNMPKKLL